MNAAKKLETRSDEQTHPTPVRKSKCREAKVLGTFTRIVKRAFTLSKGNELDYESWRNLEFRNEREAGRRTHRDYGAY